MFAFQNVPPAPGGGETAPAQPVTGHAPSSQGASNEGGGAPPGLFGSALLPLLMVGMIIFLFWSNRSTQKKQEAALANLKKGDKVLAQGYLAGRLVELEPRYAKIEIAPGVKVQVLRTSLTRDSEEAAATATSKKDVKAEPPAEKKT